MESVGARPNNSEFIEVYLWYEMGKRLSSGGYQKCVVIRG